MQRKLHAYEVFFNVKPHAQIWMPSLASSHTILPQVQILHEPTAQKLSMSKTLKLCTYTNLPHVPYLHIVRVKYTLRTTSGCACWPNRLGINCWWWDVAYGERLTVSVHGTSTPSRMILLDVACQVLIFNQWTTLLTYCIQIACQPRTTWACILPWNLRMFLAKFMIAVGGIL